MTKFVTVVYAVNDEEAFESIHADIKKMEQAFIVDPKTSVGVSAFSSTDEIHRLELVEQALNNQDSDEAVDNAQAILRKATLPQHSPSSITV